MTFSLADAAACVRVPSATDDKYSRGVLGTVTGSRRFPGAAVLGVEAAMRTGVGMVRLVAPDDVARLVLARRPELVVGAGRVQAWLLGSGMTVDDRSAGASEALEAAVADDVPVVLDAGALDLAPKAAGRAILTPHAGEAVRLLQHAHPAVDRAAVEADPVRWARAASDATGCVVLLKGARSVVADADVVLEVPVVTRWLATAGSGDVLAGILGALVATHAGDGTPLARLAAAAIVLHDAAAATASAGGPIAALDVAEALPATIAQLLAA